MNPYQWLGIDPQIKNPNYFQLLGIKSLATDEAEFVRQVQQGVKAKLNLLDRPELAAHAEIVGKLKQRITVAGEVLADSAKRTLYVEQLKTAAHGSAKSAPPSAAQPSVSTKADGASGDNLPLARPARKPGARKPGATSGPAPAKPASKIHFDESTESEPAQQISPLGDAVLKINRPAKRKASPWLMIGGSLIIIASMGGLVLMAFMLSRPRTPAIAVADKPIERAVQDSLASNKTDTASIEDVLKKPAMNSVPESETEPAVAPEVEPESASNPKSEPETKSQTKSVPQTEPKPLSGSGESAETDQMSIDSSDVPSPKATDDPEMNPAEGETKSDPSEKPSDAEPSKPNAEAEPKKTAEPKTEPQAEPRTKHQPLDVWEPDPERELIVPNEFEQYIIDKHLRIVLNRQRLRDAEGADKHLDELLRCLETFLLSKHPDKFTPYDRIARSLLDVNVDLAGFWDQFEASATKIPPGQEIIVFDRPLSFVEYADGQLVMRGPGFNIRYRREHVPAELAIKIAEQGAIPDVPSWRLYLAAFIATQKDGVFPKKERLTELLESIWEDGRDTSVMDYFVSFQADPRPIRFKAEMPNMNSIAAVTNKVQAQSSEFFGLDIQEMQMEELYDFWMNWDITLSRHVESMEDQPELKNEKPGINTSLVLIHNAISIAVATSEAALLEEAVAELGYLTSQDADKILLEHLSKIATKKLDLNQAIELKRVSEPLIARATEDRKLRTIAKRLQTRLKSHERQHKLNGTGQTFGALR